MEGKYLTEEWRKVIEQMVLSDCFKDQPDIQAYIDFIEQLIKTREDRAREEGMFTEDEIWTLSALVESKIDEIWDTMTLGTEKIVQEQSDDLHRLLSKLTTK